MTSATRTRQRVIILGALSTIAEALARRLAASGCDMVIAGRGSDRLEQVASDLKLRGAVNVIPWTVDFASSADAKRELDAMTKALGGGVDVIVVAYGVLGDQQGAQADQSEFDKIIEVNFSSAARWCEAAAATLEAQSRGTLLAISSVAGDRGRQSNYVYGAAKAGLTTLMEGIAHRLARKGARAVVAKLGFVDTAMTAHIAKGGLLWAKSDDVARRLQRVLMRSGPTVVYIPWFWRPIMTIIRNVPSGLFHRTKL
ncbi:MAG: SDR family NAD(P)-dependent oxidoreductase [Roseimicrobium sp.]